MKNILPMIVLTALTSIAVPAMAEPTNEAACKRVVDAHLEGLKSRGPQETTIRAEVIENLRNSQSDCEVYSQIRSDIIDQ